MSLRLALVSALILIIAGCGPIQASSAIKVSKTALDKAHDEGADAYAPYEYYKALAFYDEAKQREGMAEFYTAKAYAQKSTKLAKDSLGTTRRRKELERRRLRGKANLKGKLGPRFERKKKPLRPRTRRAP